MPPNLLKIAADLRRVAALFGLELEVDSCNGGSSLTERLELPAMLHVDNR